MFKSTASPLNESFDFQSSLDWVFAHWQTLLSVFLLILSLLGISYYFVFRQTAENWKAYTQAPLDLANMSDPVKEAEAFKQLSTLLNEYPALRPFYEGPAAQELLNQKRLSEAEPLIQRTFERTRSLFPLSYLSYAENSVLIDQGRFKEALSSAYSLKTRLDTSKEEASPVLYMFNLLRIALLEKQMQNKEKLEAAWKEMEQIRQGAGRVKLSPQMLNWILNHFDNESADLKQYLNL
jgi:hypothetical protein